MNDRGQRFGKESHPAGRGSRTAGSGSRTAGGKSRAVGGKSRTEGRESYGTGRGSRAVGGKSRTDERRGSTGPFRRDNPGAPWQDVERETPDEERDVVAGRHPVLEALKTGRTINKLLVSEGAEGGSLNEVLARARENQIVVQRVPKAKLDVVAGKGHQGVAAYVSPQEYADLEDVIERKTNQEPLIVVLDEIADPHNLGAIIRTADAAGVQGVIIPKRRAVPLTTVVAKAAAGALEHVPVARVGNLVQILEQLKQHGYWIVGLDVAGQQSYTAVDYKGPVAIVIGAEGKGLTRLIRETCDYIVKLPMLGSLESLNASVATGVMLYEVIRQRH